MNELKPCPFCGNEPEFENTDERARLRCAGCGTEGGLFFYSQEECESGIGDATEARAIEAWNTRAAVVPVGVPPSSGAPAPGSEAFERWRKELRACIVQLLYVAHESKSPAECKAHHLYSSVMNLVDGGPSLADPPAAPVTPHQT